jgi:hypothetical protein
MDKENIEASKVLVTQGSNAFIKHVFTGDISYAEMRAKYG